MLLPKFFCIQDNDSYKVYMNTIHNSQETEHQDINVIWPMENIEARAITIKQRDKIEYNALVRKWDYEEYQVLDWYLTGSAVDMTLRDRSITISCPVISIIEANIWKLPYNSHHVSVSDVVALDEEDVSSYMTAVIYRTDPNSPENTAPIPPRVAAAEAINSTKGLPLHVANIVLSEAIRNNEICPITNEPITATGCCVTSCGHVYFKEAIEEWLSRPASHGKCPVCKQVCI